MGPAPRRACALTASACRVRAAGLLRLARAEAAAGRHAAAQAAESEAGRLWRRAADLDAALRAAQRGDADACAYYTAAAAAEEPG